MPRPSGCFAGRSLLRIQVRPVVSFCAHVWRLLRSETRVGLARPLRMRTPLVRVEIGCREADDLLPRCRGS